MNAISSAIGLKVYLTEPSPMQARIIMGQLNALDISRVQTFGRGGDVLAAMRAAKPDLVISSLYLPDMSGTNLIEAMRADPDLQHVPFILISSETRPHALDPVRQSGVCGILPKPFSEAQLKTAIMTTLDYLHEDDSLATAGLDLEAIKVLIVDDSQSARRFIRRVLENLGISRFLEAENGVQAMNVLSDQQVDLVVTDYNMPEMDGRALVEHIRSKSWQASVPILMVTSESDEGRLAGVEEAGVSGICDKPFSPDVVKRLLSHILTQGD